MAEGVRTPPRKPEARPLEGRLVENGIHGSNGSWFVIEPLAENPADNAPKDTGMVALPGPMSAGGRTNVIWIEQLAGPVISNSPARAKSFGRTCVGTPGSTEPKARSRLLITESGGGGVCWATRLVILASDSTSATRQPRAMTRGDIGSRVGGVIPGRRRQRFVATSCRRALLPTPLSRTGSLSFRCKRRS